jgi:hypothetical protein
VPRRARDPPRPIRRRLLAAWLGDSVTIQGALFQSGALASPPVGTNPAVDRDGSGRDWQIIKLAYGIENSFVLVSPADPLPVQVSSLHITPSPTGGLNPYRRLATADTNLDVVKGSPGQVYGWHLTNLAVEPRFVKLYNKATNPSIPGDAPLYTLPVLQTAPTVFSTDIGLAFPNGIALAITTGVADTDTGAVGLNDVVVNLFFQ